MTRKPPILVPATGPEDWKRCLADPEAQWVTGYSARTLAYRWHDATGIPDEIQAALASRPELAALDTLLILPELRVPLPGRGRASQTDLWVLARGRSGLVSMAVEGKVTEPFGQTVGHWLVDASAGKQARLEFILGKLGLGASVPDEIRYQLLHRAASAVIEAERFGARHAVMVVHSFSGDDRGFEDYAGFLALFGATARPGELVSVEGGREVPLYFAWVRGPGRYREA